MALFQSTHPSGVRQLETWRFALRIDFNPRTPVGCDPCLDGRGPPRRYFNPRTPVGCDDRDNHRSGGGDYFNPRTPVGCDRQQRLPRRNLPISIHAPQWGATGSTRTVTRLKARFQSTHPSGVRRRNRVRIQRRKDISIHAPQWGATVKTARGRHAGYYFNPRTPVGCDGVSGLGDGLSIISIHAPQWGATWADTVVSVVDIFQSTHPSGVRRLYQQSRGPAGRISIHAPQWGATLIAELGAVHVIISIHAPQWGATRFVVSAWLMFLYFNPRTPVGCDTLNRFRPPSWSNFNPRTPVGCDLLSSSSSHSHRQFQSTHPSGVRRRWPTGCV